MNEKVTEPLSLDDHQDMNKHIRIFKKCDLNLIRYSFFDELIGIFLKKLL